jgi:hypothetical protein
VEFTFRPRGLRLGAGITLVSLGMVFALSIRWRPRAAATVAAVVLVLSASVAHAALPAPPFELGVTPATFVSGSDPSVTIRPRVGAAGRWDLYVVWLYSERAVFLGADGAWRPRPTPFRAGASAGETTTATWKNAGPAGEATLALLTVDPGGNPLERLDWRFRPSLATVKISAPPTPRALPYDTLAVLLVASLAAVALVLRWPRSPTPRAADRTRSTSRRPLPADSRP